MEEMVSSFKTLYADNDLILTVGGLGPTSDDMTRDMVATVMNSPLEWREEVWQEILQVINNKTSLSNRQQAFFPSDFQVIPNPWGTAPGFYQIQNSKFIASLPGPPGELQPMVTEYLLPQLAEWAGPEVPPEEILFSTFLLPESQLEDSLKEMAPEGMDWSTIASQGQIRVTLRGGAESCERVLKQMSSRYGALVVQRGHESLPRKILDLCIQNNRTLAGAESCTGGMVAKDLTDLAGASQVLVSSQVVYSNASKKALLGVTLDTLDTHGAVSEETVSQLLVGLEKQSLGNTFFAVSGIAGPGGGSEDKPVGTVVIGVKSRGKKAGIYRFLFKGNREFVRKKTVKAVFLLLEKEISGQDGLDRLLERPYI